jgi:hypothetical protein
VEGSAGKETSAKSKQTSRRGKLTDVETEELLKELRIALEEAERAGAKGRVSVEDEKGVGHGGGQTPEARVGLLVDVEIASLERFGEGDGLTEAEAESFAGDGVD